MTRQGTTSSHSSSTARKASTGPAGAAEAPPEGSADVGLPLAGAFVRGRSALPELLRRFQPATVLASTTGGDVRFSGLLADWLQVQGSPAEAEALVAAEASTCRFIDPQPGQPYGLSAG